MYAKQSNVFVRTPENMLIHKIFPFLSGYDKKRIEQIIKKINEKNGLKEINNIYQILKKYKIDEEFNSNRQDFIVSKIKTYLDAHDINWETIVDIGGGNGNILSQLNASSASASSCKDNFICVETKTDWQETYELSNDNITYLFWDNKHLPILDNTADIILCMVSLHHMPEPVLEQTIKHITRIMKPGGILLIKEHDATIENLEYIEWEHYLYHLLDNWKKNVDILDLETYFKTVTHRFMPSDYWKEMFIQNSFIWKQRTNRFLDGPFIPDQKNVSNLYWDVFVKSSISEEFNP